MSHAEAERFVADLKQDAGMRDALKGQPATLDAVVAFAKGKGYDVSADDALAYLKAQSGEELSDEELDAVAGGKGAKQVIGDVGGALGAAAPFLAILAL